MKNFTTLSGCKKCIAAKIMALLFLAFLFPTSKVAAQCSFDNPIYIAYTPVYDGIPHVADPCFWGGDLMTLQVIAGSTYTFSTCSSTAFDTQITVYDAAGTTELGYNDDFCGANGYSSQVTVVAAYSGTMNVLLDEYNCATNSGPCMPMEVTASPAPVPVLPSCANTPSINCPGNINQNAANGTCSAVVTYTNPVGTSPCDGPAIASINSGIAILDNASSSSTLNITTFVAGGLLGGQIYLQSVCMEVNHTYVGDLIATLTSPSGTAITLFNRPGTGTNGCSGDDLNLCIVQGTGNSLDDIAACGNLPAYSGNYTASSADLTTLNDGGSANGNWILSISDNAGGDVGNLVSWSLNFTTITYTHGTSGLASGSTFPVGITTNVFTATDAYGNSSSCNFDVVIADNQPPSITCTNTTINSIPGVCEATNVILVTPPATDNCGIASVTNNASGTTFPVGATTFTWTVTDVNGNTASCTQTVTVVDNEVPVITCVGMAPVNIDAGSCTASNVNLGNPSTSDNCGVFSVINDAPLVFNRGNTSVTWTVTDVNGNTASCTKTITVIDNEVPTISCPATITASADAGLCSASNLNLGSPATSDNCGVASTLNNAPSTFNVGTTVVTWTVTDSSGNMASCSQTVIVTDNEAPTISCSPTVSLNVSGGTCSASNANLVTPFSTDNCGVVSTTNDAPATLGLGTTTVTWTVTDASGNSASCMQAVTVNDDEDPTIICPADVSVSADAGLCSASNLNLGTPSTSDDCGVASISNDAAVVFNVGNTTVIWTVTDANGNTASCAQIVTVTDDEDPTIICPADISVSADAGLCSASNLNLGTPSTSDNCGVASISNDAAVVFNVGNTTVIWTVTDANGNTASCAQTVTVTDDEDPTIICPADISVSADAGLCSASNLNLGTSSTSDNCGVASISNDAPLAFNAGITTITWTVTDINGNTASCTQTVTVTDDVDPTISCPAHVSVSTDAGLCSASNVNLGTPSTSDNCGVASTSNDAPLAFNMGTTMVTWTVTDVNGNTATCTQTVAVFDNEDPTISCPPDVSVSTDAGICSASNVNLGTPSTSDNCGVASTSNDAPLSFNLGNTIVTWTVTDVNGNTGSCIQTVTVTDDVEPTISCPVDVSVSTDAGLCSASNVDLGIPNTFDNCGVAFTSNDAPSSFNTGTTTVTWTVTDVNGNTATCAQTVAVLDDENPTIICPTDISVSADAGLCSASNVSLGTEITSDNCGVATVTNDAPAVFNAGTTNVTWTVTDVNGNAATCVQTVTVTETNPPTITCPGDVTVSNDVGLCSASNVNLGIPNTSDNCGVASTTNDAPATFNVGSTTVTWTVTDASGNTASCIQTVVVNDTENPFISCAAQSLSANAGTCGASSSTLTAPSTSDNCGVGTVSNDAPVTLLVGTTTVTWTVTDVNGNSATCSQIVTITDNELPTITCPSSVSTNPNAGSCAANNISLGTPVTGDNCGVATVTNDAPVAFGTGNTTVTWTVTDVNGNTSTCTQMVTVLDNIVPNITCPAAVSVNADAGSCEASNVSLGTPATSDNCGVATITNDAPITFAVGNTTVTWTVTDNNGNTSSCGQTVTVSSSIDTSISVSGTTYTANAAGATYQWFDCTNNTNIGGANVQSFTPTVSGSYALIVTQNGCSDTSTCFSVIIIGIHSVVMNATLGIFPNPATEEVNVQITGIIEGSTKVQLFDVEGRLVRDFAYENMSGTYRISLDNLAGDVYELRITTAQGIWNNKVMKVN